MTTKDWGGSGKKKKEVESWLAETGAMGEWRCGNGNGPADQCRVVVIVQQKMEEVIEFLNGFSTPTGTTLEHALEHTNDDGTHDIYHAAKMPWPFAERDFKLRSFTQIEEDEARLFMRSVEDSDEGLKKTALLGRVRAKLSIGCYHLQRVGDATRVTYVLECHLGGVMELDAIARRAVGPQLKSIVDGVRHLGVREVDGEDEETGRGSSVWRAAPRWLRAISSGAELGSNFFKRKGGEDRWKEDGAADDEERDQKPAAEIEMGTMEANPLHCDAGKEKKADKNKKTDNGHILRAASGGFGRKVDKESRLKKDGRKSEGEVAALDRASAEKRPPTLPPKALETTATASVEKVEEWVQCLDTKSGYEYWENVVTGETTWEKR
jgi:hypothetical protein